MPTAADVVRAYFDAWNRRDLEAMGATLAEEVEWERSAEFPEGRTLRGRAGVIEFAETMFEIFSETSIELVECDEIDAGTVLVVGRSRFRGSRSGAQTEARWVRLYDVANGLIVAVRPYADREQALAAATNG